MIRTSFLLLSAACLIAACGEDTQEKQTLAVSEAAPGAEERITLEDPSAIDPTDDLADFLPASVAMPTPATYTTYETAEEDPAIVKVFDHVKGLAREQAAAPYQPVEKVPNFARKLTYDDYRRIQFREDAVLFADEASPFQMRLDPAGSLFETPIKINLVKSGKSQPIKFNPDSFQFGEVVLTEDQKQQLGLAGFRLLSPLNKAGKFDEILSVKGASFFRALGVGNYYGTSARGIALKTASSEGEEFPYFKEFWIQEPELADQTIVFHALLDSPSMTGAYQFRVTPGASTIVDVEAEIFARQQLTKIGIAPLTSMFEFGPHDPDQGANDFRPRVHDAEALSARLANGEWIWRPLSNPKSLQISSFTRDTPQGFGLIQRSRDYEAYQDIEAHYQDRPSVWVSPGDGWDNGELVLIEIPSPNEYNDNIIALWRLRTPLEPGESHNFSFRLNWGDTSPVNSPLAPVHSTRTGLSEVTGRRMFIIDFDVARPSVLEDVVPSVSTTSGKIENVNLIRDTQNNRARIVFELDPENANLAELRVQLRRANAPASETWLYRWTQG